MFDYNSFIIVSLIGACLAAISTASLSVFVTLKKISFMSDAFSHIAFAGIAIAILFGFNITFTATIFVLFISFLITYITKKFKNEPVNITTIFLSLSMAIAIILLSLKKGYAIDLSSYLFGNILFIDSIDIIFLSILLIINIFFIIFFYNSLFYSTYNSESAKVYGINIDLIYYLFNFLLALNIVITVKSIGIILITAQLILPGMSALNFKKNIVVAIILAIIFSLLSTIFGFIFTYFFNLPSGPVIVCFNFCFYTLSLIKVNLIKIIKNKN